MRLSNRFRHAVRSLNCPVCHRWLRCECGWIATAALIAGVVVAAAGAGYGAYSASEAQSMQNAALKKNYQLQADQQKAVALQEQQAGEARAKAIQYDADRRQKSFLSNAAASGVDVSSPSLLESVTQFGSDTGYAKSMAKYSGDLTSASSAYKSDLYGYASRSTPKLNPGMSGAISGGSTLATGALNYGAKLFNTGPVGGYTTGASDMLY
jgi:hypothetical protein